MTMFTIGQGTANSDCGVIRVTGSGFLKDLLSFGYCQYITPIITHQITCWKCISFSQQCLFSTYCDAEQIKDIVVERNQLAMACTH